MDFASYGIKDASRFKGREEEIKKFLRIMDSGTMSVLYANSGIGKTSFLNAGISPVYQMVGYFPVHIVFPDEVFTHKDMEPWLLQRIKDAFVKQDGNSDENDRFTWESTIENDIEQCQDSLWWHLHTKVMKDQTTGETYRPLIIFDQFEEMFTKSKKYANSEIIQHFFRLVGQLASTSLPSEIEKELDRQDDRGNYVEIDSEHHYKVVFSLRKEYLSDFDYWTNDVNTISELHQNRMFLLPLKREQAEKVITQQPIGEDSTVSYVTLNKVTERILDLIDHKRKDEIEPYMLSTLCSKLYNQAVSNHKEQLEPNDVDANISNIILEIYEDKVQEVFHDPDHLKRFEDALVDSDGHRNRPKIKELDDIRFKEVYQKQLEDAHLIRTDTYDEDVYIELIHDLLAKAINKKRKMAEQERRIAELEKSKKRQKYIYSGLVTILLAVLAYGFYQLYSTPVWSVEDDKLVYQLCLKATVMEFQDEKKNFGPDDYWDVNLLFWTKDETDTLRLAHPIDPAHCNFHKGGGADSLVLTFTKAEIDSLKEILVEVRPKTTLCKKVTIPINLLKRYSEPIPISISKNYEETDLYEGTVYTVLNNRIDPIPLNEALIVVADRTTYTNESGHYAINIPRGNAISNRIYVIKQGYCSVDVVLQDNLTISLKRDTTMNFMQRYSEIKGLWEIASYTKRNKKETDSHEKAILKKFQINTEYKKYLKRGFNETDSLKYVCYENDTTETISAKKGDVRNVLGTYKDKNGIYIFEGNMTLENADSSKWLLDITQYDSIFNTRKRKATLLFTNDNTKTQLLFDRK